MQIVSEFIWVNLRFNGPKSKPKPLFCTSPLPVIRHYIRTEPSDTVITSFRPTKYTRDRQTAWEPIRVLKSANTIVSEWVSEWVSDMIPTIPITRGLPRVKNVCRNGVSRVNFSKYTQNGPSKLASTSLVNLVLPNICSATLCTNWTTMLKTYM